MTEEEAKTKWCPFVRYLAIFRSEDGSRECAGAYNRGAQDSGTGNARCIGSACMAWRILLEDEYERIRTWQRPAGDGWFQSAEHTYASLPEWSRVRANLGTGYCGLAGRP